MENSTQSTLFNISELKLSSSSGHPSMPVIGLDCSVDKSDIDALKLVVLEAIELGYRHFDTAAIYGTEKALGEAIAEALRLGLVSSREQLFITSKLWCQDAHQYLDLYLIHWPISSKPVEMGFAPVPKEDLLPMDYKGVWEAMEDSQTLGLTKSIGLSNFSCKKIETILTFAIIPPSINQIEMNPLWQQKKLRVSLRWIVEQGATVVVRSLNKERMKQNMGIFDWELVDDDYKKINQIPQRRLIPSDFWVSPQGPFQTPEELWDD
ncbi:Aldo ket red domain-containing protein [Citrus sinensis]|nr:Aldo ket red domain-containing protein [Citrus sinensis]